MLLKIDECDEHPFASSENIQLHHGVVAGAKARRVVVMKWRREPVMNKEEREAFKEVGKWFVHSSE